MPRGRLGEQVERAIMVVGDLGQEKKRSVGGLELLAVWAATHLSHTVVR